MRTIDGFLLEMADTTINGNRIKVVVLEQLLKDNLIDEETFEEYSTSWNIIIVKRSWFKKWLEKFSNNKDENSYMIKYVKF